QQAAKVASVAAPAEATSESKDEDKPPKKVADAVRKANPPAPGKELGKALPKPKLDLHLPKEAVEKLVPDTARNKEEPLLPPMFEERQAAAPFQLNGRLITKEREDAIEGAELRFEFKR
ncbi:hypothetical protein, partial [Pseudomonas sp. RIT-PI-AD]|uniref:hypothetical protein n=1 Tax=Pseudomonas sp. RIT-PI-AD TaxID=3035294 RepID=UPI0021D99D70